MVWSGKAEREGYSNRDATARDLPFIGYGRIEGRKAEAWRRGRTAGLSVCDRPYRHPWLSVHMPHMDVGNAVFAGAKNCPYILYIKKAMSELAVEADAIRAETSVGP